MKNKPLEGIRIADFGWVYAVPHGTAWLGSLGAEIIRFESMTRLDLIRGNPALGVSPNAGGGFNGVNLSKKSITVNLGNPRGAELAKEIIKVSDVVTENFAFGVMEKFGLGWDVVQQIKPDAIMLRGSPLGQTGPEREATGWGPNTQAYAGLPYITGYEGGPPGGLGGIWPDYMIGVTMAFHLLTALHYRANTGKGQLIDLAMAETVTTMIPEAVLEFTMNGRQAKRMGNRHPGKAPRGVYRCSGPDKWVAIEVNSDDEWRRMRSAMGDPDWARDSRFDDVLGRLENHDEIDAGITSWTRERHNETVMAILQDAGIAAAPCPDLPDLMADPQIQHRGLLVELDHAEMGPRTHVGLPGKFSAMPELEHRPTPLLGEHNEEIFCGLLGMSRDDVERLVEEKIIY